MGEDAYGTPVVAATTGSINFRVAQFFTEDSFQFSSVQFVTLLKQNVLRGFHWRKQTFVISLVAG